LENKGDKISDKREIWGVELSESQTRRVLRDRLKMKFAKPYPKDYRIPTEAEDILAGNLETVRRFLKEKGIKKKR
jgi:hypothetical protein